ncbi:MAG: pimeloyl-CoA dehydrogenase small subunit, partial [Burkholderiales bacterium]|nr:pimeloyl-CoA dehydrogenase small subunit [Burkholderiales bacterium]
MGDAKGISLFLVPAGAAGLAQHAYANHDGQRAAELTLTGV